MKFSHSTNGFYIEAIHGDSIPADAVEINSDEHTALLDGQSLGKIIVASPGGYPILIDPPMPNQDEIIEQYERALDNHLDTIAKLYRYDNRFTFALRAGFEGPYQAESIEFAKWMDECNVSAFADLQAVTNGLAEIPTIEEFINGLPVFVL